MKKLIIALFCLTTGIIKAQDSIGIDSTDFTVQSSNFYLDTLDFTYYPSKSGTQSIEQIRTRVDVNTGTNSFPDSVESTVIINGPNNSVDFSQTSPAVFQRMVLEPAVFKNGNNTVVIWPGNANLPAKDSINVNIFVSGYESVGPSPLLEKVKVINNQDGLFFQNKENIPVTLRVYELSGKIVSLIEITRKGTRALNLKEGVYFITLIQKNNYFIHKTQVLR